MPDQHNLPRVDNVNEAKSIESTAADPTAIPAAQVGPVVDNKPHTSTDAEPGDPQVNIGADTKDVELEPNVVKIVYILIQVLEKQVPKEGEINESNKPQLTLPLPTSDDIHHSALKPYESLNEIRKKEKLLTARVPVKQNLKSNNEQTMNKSINKSNNEQSSKAAAKDLNKGLAPENKEKTLAKMAAENAAKDAARRPLRDVRPASLSAAQDPTLL